MSAGSRDHPSSRVAVYGGAFDPPHLGHVFTVTYLLGRDDVDEVWVLPTADHVFGKRMAPLEARMEMLALALAPFGDRVRIDDFEARREGPSRTFDTLGLLSEAHPQHSLLWVMGADNLSERHRWYRFDDLVARWPMVVMERPGHEQALYEASKEAWCRPGPRLPAISSTTLRRALAGVGEAAWLRWLPSSVLERARGLYGAPEVPEGLPKTAWVFGAGRAGLALADGLRVLGLKVQVWNRSEHAAAEVCGPLPEALEAELWFIAVSDGAIAEVVARLAARAARPQLVLHCAARLSAKELQPLADVPTASLHPLQSLRGTREGLRGAYMAVEGPAVEAAATLAKALGGKPVRLPEGAKAAYHAAAVYAGNFSTTLAHGGSTLLQSLGIDEATARAMLLPLMRGTLAQLEGAPPAEALTGPLARGDEGAIEAHLAAIEARCPALAEPYRVLAEATRAMLQG